MIYILSDTNKKVKPDITIFPAYETATNQQN